MREHKVFSVADILPLVFLATLLFLYPLTLFFHMKLLLSPVATSGSSPPGLLALLPAVTSRYYSPYSLCPAPSPDYDPSRPEKPPLHLSPWASCCVLAVSQAGTSLSWL